MKMTLHDYAKMVEGVTCRFCETKLSTKIHAYDHEGGWLVDGFHHRQWLYAICPGCEYQWALWKLGIPRATGDVEEANG